ncbi:MAG: hypothetical protein ACRCSE_07495 [Vibrio sp.]
MSFLELLIGAGLLLIFSGFSVVLMVMLFRATSPSLSANAERPRWPSLRRVMPAVTIGMPSRGFWRIFVWYLERFL